MVFWCNIKVCNNVPFSMQRKILIKKTQSASFSINISKFIKSFVINNLITISYNEYNIDDVIQISGKEKWDY